MKRFAWVSSGFAVAVALLGAAGGARGQAADAALKDRVAQLVERLEAPKDDARKAAEEALVKLGDRALPLLPDPASVTGDDRKKRLARVRDAIREAAEAATNLAAAKVTLKGKGIRLSEAVLKLQAQSGNAVTDLREAEGAEVTNPSLDLDVEDKPFLEALDVVCQQAEVTPNFYTGDGTIGLMAGKPPKSTRVAYTGPFRVQFKQIAAARDFVADTNTANAQFEVAWEPRLRPMLLALKAEDVKVVDDQGKAVEAEVTEESSSVVLRPENPVAEVNLNLKAPERAAKTIASLKFKAAVTVPSGLKAFRFPTIALKEPKTVKQGDIAVTLEGAEVDEQVWKVNVVLDYPGGGEVFESYRQGLFNNRLWLQKADGFRFEHNGGFSNTMSDAGKLGFEYLFVDAPGKPADFGLVYETPSKVLTIPLDVEFKDVPLP